MKAPRAGEFALALALAAVLGLAGARDDREALTEEAAPGLDTGGVARPLGLAFETARLVAGRRGDRPAGRGARWRSASFRTDLAGRRGMLACLALSAFVPMPIHAASWIGALGNLGRSQLFGTRPILVGWPGAAFVHALAAIPWVVLLVGVGLRSVEPELEEAALMDLPAWRVGLRDHPAAGDLVRSPPRPWPWPS